MKRPQAERPAQGQLLCRGGGLSESRPSFSEHEHRVGFPNPLKKGKFQLGLGKSPGDAEDGSEENVGVL